MKRLLILGICGLLGSNLEAGKVSKNRATHEEELAQVGIGVSIGSDGYYYGGYAVGDYYDFCPGGYVSPGYYQRRWALGFFFGPGVGYYYQPHPHHQPGPQFQNVG